MEVLKICDVSFIRCLKPNLLKQKENFQNTYVLQQIKYLGVLESIKIRKDGFPFRKDYKLFFQQYFELNIELDKKTELDNLNSYSQNMLKDKCWRIMRNIILEDKDFYEKVLFGHTKINTKQEIATYLDKLILDPNRKKILEGKLIQLHNKKAVLVQSFCKMVVPRKKYLYKKLVVKNLNKTFAENWTERTAEFVRILRNMNLFCKKWRKVENKMMKFKLKCFLKYKQKAKLKTKYLSRRKSAIQLNEFWEKKMERRFLAKMIFQINLLKNLENFSLSIENLQILYKSKLESFFLKSFFICLSDRKAFVDKCLKSQDILSILFQKKLKNCFEEFKNNALSKEEEETKENDKHKVEKLLFSRQNSKLQNVFKENLAMPELNKIIMQELYVKQLKKNYKAMQKKLLIFLTRKIMKPVFQIFITSNQEFEENLHNSKNQAPIGFTGTALEIKEFPTKLCGIITLALKPIKHENYTFSVALLKKETQEFFAYDSVQTPIQKLIFTPAPNVISYENIEDSIDTLNEFDFEEKKISEPALIKKNSSIFSKIFARHSEIKIDLIKQKEEKQSLENIRKYILKFYDEELNDKTMIKSAIEICSIAYRSTAKTQEEIYYQIAKHLENYFEKTKLLRRISFLNLRADYEGFFLKSLKLLIIATTCLPSTKSNHDSIISIIYRKLTTTKTNEEMMKYSSYAAKRIERSLSIKPTMEFPDKEVLEQVLKMKKIRIKIKFLYEKSHELQIETFDTVRDVLKKVIDDLELNYLQKYLGIYLDFEDGIFIEEDKSFIDQLTYYKNKTNKTIFIFLRIKLFPQKNLFFNTDFVCILYTQMFYNYLLGKYHLESDEEAVYELSAWAYFIDKGKYSGNQHISVIEYCPENFFKPETLIKLTEKIMAKYKEISENSITKKIAMGNFVGRLREIDNESHHSFEGNFIKIIVDKYGDILEEHISNKVVLFVKDHELMIMNKKKNAKNNREIFGYKSIICYGCLENTQKFVWRELGEHDNIYFFECSKCDQIERLMEGYLKLLMKIKI